MKDKSLFYLSPHPGLLPEGEGIAPIIELCSFMPAKPLIRQGVH